MPQEIEVKFRLDDPNDLRVRLSDRGARTLSHVLEINHIFDTADRGLLATDCGLRLRTAHNPDTGEPVSATLTYKGPRAAGVAKSREEVETVVADASATETILLRLGYSEVIVYEKRRETWHLDECEVCLDELPRLGWFVEIEGPDAATIRAAQERLGLSDTTLLHETYAELAATHGTPAGEGSVRLGFAG